MGRTPRSRSDQLILPPVVGRDQIIQAHNFLTSPSPKNNYFHVKCSTAAAKLVLTFLGVLALAWFAQLGVPVTPSAFAIPISSDVPAPEASVEVSVLRKKTNRVVFQVTNTGAKAANFQLFRSKNITAPNQPNESTSDDSGSPFKFRYFVQNQNVTKAITTGKAFAALSPGESIGVRVSVSSKRRLAFNRKIRVRLTAVNEADSSLQSSASTRMRLDLPKR